MTVSHFWICRQGVVPHSSLRLICTSADLMHVWSQVRAVMRKTAKVTAKRMLANYMGKATPNGMDPAAAAKLTVKVRCSVFQPVPVLDCFQQ